MAKTQVTGEEILDASVGIEDLENTVVPYVRERSKSSDLISLGDTILVLITRHHIVMTELIVDGDIILDGTIGIL